MEKEFEKVQEAIGYHFENYDLLLQAFTRKSYSQENGGQNNEVLEFVGDKVLDFIITKILVERFGSITDDKKWNELKLRNPKYFQTKSKEGVFTDIKKDLVQKKSLSAAINELGFQNLLYLGEGDIANNVQEQDSVKEDLFEAIVGAVAIDSNWDIAELTNVVESMLNLDDYFNNELEIDNYTSLVQEAILKNTGKLPAYEFRYDRYDEEYICSLNFDNQYFRGMGINKVKARRECAKEVYEYLDDNGYFDLSIVEMVGEPTPTRCIAQLNELYQKGYIDKPVYTFNEYSDCWQCKVSSPGIDFYVRENGKTKKESQRNAALHFLKCLIEEE